MIVFPNCKLNLGLSIIRKRIDGFHDLQTVFYPLQWCDALEVVEKSTNKKDFHIDLSGLPVKGKTEDNLLFKCWQLLQHKLPAISVHLHKNIPMGAGLGGGSSDAAFFLELLNNKFELNLTLKERLELAVKLGSDCPFFILNKPVFAEGKGEVFSQIHIDLSNYYILCIFPNIHSNTKLAFQAIRPQDPIYPLRESIQNSISDWKNKLINDFEKPVFSQFPILSTIKQELYQQGAIYASMSGSGSAMFGVFKERPSQSIAENYLHYLQCPSSKSL